MNIRKIKLINITPNINKETFDVQKKHEKKKISFENKIKINNNTHSVKHYNDEKEKNKNVIPIFEMPYMTEAEIDHLNENPASSINATFCGTGKKECKFKKDCEILKMYDNFIYKSLKNNCIPSIEILKCNHYASNFPYSLGK